MYAAPHSWKRAATADVGDAVVDVVVGGFGGGAEQACCGHDHAWLTIATLGHIKLGPGLLNGVGAIVGQAFDSDNLLLRTNRADRVDAGADRLAVDVHRAGAALGNAATVLSAGEFKFVPQNPQQGRGWVDGNFYAATVDVESLGLCRTGQLRLPVWFLALPELVGP